MAFRVLLARRMLERPMDFELRVSSGGWRSARVRVTEIMVLDSRQLPGRKLTTIAPCGMPTADAERHLKGKPAL